MRYPQAVWKGPSPNCGGRIGAIRLGVVHIMTGTLAGTDSWFMNPSAQVSAHFGVGKTGVVHQYLDTDTVAWAEMSYNDCAISIEHEGHTGDSLTPQQIAADRALVQWLNTVHGIPVAMTTPNGHGWVGHGQLGAAGGDHLECPGTPVLAQWPQVLSGASPTPSQPTAPPQPKEVPQMYCTDPESGKVLATTPNGDLFAEPGISDLTVANLAQHSTWHAGYAESIGTNPCVGLTPWKDPNGQWGWCFITQPTSGTGGFGPYDLYHFKRTGAPA